MTDDASERDTPAKRFDPEELPRVRRICTTHGPVSSSPCPDCEDETYDLTKAEDHAFVRSYVHQRRARRHMSAGIFAIALAYAAMIVGGQQLALLVALAAVGLGEWVLYRRLSIRQRWVERQVSALQRGRRITSVPVFAIGLTLLAFALTKKRVEVGLLGDQTADVLSEAALIWALVPAQVLAGEQLHTLLTHALLHASWAHVLGNALGLLLFGLAVDLRVGRARCALVVLVGVVAGGLSQALVAPHSELPLVGISGGVYALAGAQLALMPGRPVVLSLAGSFVRVPQWIVVVILVVPFGAVQTLLWPQIAWMAHLGGCLAGILLGLAMRRIPVPADFRDAEAERELLLPA